ncbi:hypothetical protein NDNC_0860 [Candidatus Nasuia deltocephalinicola]|uniref:Small ribosomal subunit protein uS15 n=1 Tax=Candidatus Nasuia deltocephalincola TaxID=1160784 RepID=A0A975A397_9PROT|nr:30S ribosomal protein S15 [Candidatus Nasuia deltocephalinicola]WKD87145.1 30S ribosomal protein S15 [Candidatus Nasuia deltocephalinicola]BEH03920.1 hypothetical protein NDNC_0860 [Candidatus Nasuia deltocephalinicola]
MKNFYYNSDFIKFFLNKYSYNLKDCGSTAIQIMFIDFKIKNLKIHIEKNKKDFSNKNKFLILINKKKKLLNYLKKIDINKYHDIIEDLNKIT